MKRASFFLPDDLRERLAAESRRSGVPVAELVRRYLDIMTPPITVGFGELRKYIDREGFLKVVALSAREGKLLVAPDYGFSNFELWVDADWVTFPEPAEQVPAPLMKRSNPPGTHQELRLNMMAPAPEKSDTADLPRMNVHPMPEEQKRVLLDRTAKEILDYWGVEARPESSPAPVPTTCGICHQPFPSKAAKRRHVRDAHSTPAPEKPKP